MSRPFFQSFPFYLCWVLISITFLSCTKKEPLALPVQAMDDTLVFETFVFEKKHNPQLNADVTFDIIGNTISGPLKHYYFNAIPTFTSNAQSVEINEVQQVSAVSVVDFRRTITYTLVSATGTSKQYTVNIIWDNQLPKVNIATNGSVPINSKQNYVATQITIAGQSWYNDFSGTAQIRGRGNTTWTFPKKSYKIKLDSEAEILGLAAEKDWVLLANYLDGTHLLNAVGMKIGQLLNMPFTNTIIPVEVTLNGAYLGCYMLTEQIEVKSNRVKVGKEGILLNLDTNFDEPWQFQSANYRLPVTIKYPKLMDAQKLATIKKDFDQLETLVARADFPNNEYLDYLDANSVAQYLLVYMLTGNEEINHPKSTYIHKTNTGKFTMGPIWDFDWAFAFEGSLEHFSSFDRPLFWSRSSKGTQFFSTLLADPAIQLLLKENWATFQSQQLPELLTYIDDYAFIVQGARTRDFGKWQQGGNNFNLEVAKLKNWISDRARYMNVFIGEL